MAAAGPRRAEDSDEDVDEDEGIAMSDGEEEAAMRLRSQSSKAAAAAAAAASQVCLPLSPAACFGTSRRMASTCHLILAFAEAGTLEAPSPCTRNRSMWNVRLLAPISCAWIGTGTRLIIRNIVIPFW